MLMAVSAIVDFVHDDLFRLLNSLGALDTFDNTNEATSMDMNQLPFRIFNVFEFPSPIDTQFKPKKLYGKLTCFKSPCHARKPWIWGYSPHRGLGRLK